MYIDLLKPYYINKGKHNNKEVPTILKHFAFKNLI